MELWNKLIKLSETISVLFDNNFTRKETESYKFEGWSDKFWQSDEIRNVHIQVIDHRETRKTWMMHINIFPKDNIDLPILGFDIVSGPNKITGSFFDYSPVNPNHILMQHFKTETDKLSWKRERELPDWAKEIFSDSMIAVGNISTEDEIDKLCNAVISLIVYYIENIKHTNKVGNFKDIHNLYCRNQKLNPHLHKSILSMGISESEKDNYLNNCLFKEIG